MFGLFMPPTPLKMFIHIAYLPFGVNYNNIRYHWSV